MGDWMFEEELRLSYGGCAYLPRCSKCAAFVKAPESIKMHEERGPSEEPHTTCHRCGPTTMICEGFV